MDAQGLMSTQRILANEWRMSWSGSMATRIIARALPTSRTNSVQLGNQKIKSSLFGDLRIMKKIRYIYDLERYDVL